ncbi:hypothetical protein [Oceanivirga salmonicida]|uniref:hypothetical protein n=1 Tax=Oceanivirga salmonicida TaxID=1769291 RepID=UPI000836ECCB|nr:hypothetical protein [Oceanivirga salmonicida]
MGLKIKVLTTKSERKTEVVRLYASAYNKIEEIRQRTGLSRTRIATMLIEHAYENIEYTEYNE